MNKEHLSDGLPQEVKLSALLAEYQAKCERLQRIVTELEQSTSQDPNALVAAQAELNEYQQFIDTRGRGALSEEDWADFREDDYTLSADDLILELEQREAS